MGCANSRERREARHEDAPPHYERISVKTAVMMSTQMNMSPPRESRECFEHQCHPAQLLKIPATPLPESVNDYHNGERCTAKKGCTHCGAYRIFDDRGDQQLTQDNDCHQHNLPLLHCARSLAAACPYTPVMVVMSGRDDIVTCHHHMKDMLPMATPDTLTKIDELFNTAVSRS